MEPRILIVDDDRGHAETLEDALEVLGLETSLASSAEEAKKLIAEGDPYAVVITDLVMGAEDGFAVLDKARRRSPSTQVLMLTGHGGREIAVKAMEEGALYYLEKPVNLDELRTKVQRALDTWRKEEEFERLKRDLGQLQGIQKLVGRSPQMQRVVDLIYQVAPTQASALILGESGTGKELVARAIHNLSPRKEEPFVALNCGGLSEGTIGSELFGHVKGAYTGAASDREGKFEYANGGTLFLDEIAEMPLEMQVQLLRVLEEQKVVRIGSNKSIPVDVRLLAATHQDLEKKIEQGKFRQDLYYRLKVVTIQLPPLRDRKSDIPLLAEHFRDLFAKMHNKDVEGIDREVLVAFSSYDWPGNVRELRNVIESMVVRARGNILTVQDLPPELSTHPEEIGDPWAFLAGKTVEEVERNQIRVTLDLFQGNRQKAAKALGTSERTLYRKLKEYGLEGRGR